MKQTLTDKEVLELEEKALEKVEDDPWRLKYHLMPISGWLNDPNGLSQINGINHILFQYTPQATHSGLPNFWGHYRTKDFINYIYSTPALYPSHEFDRNGVYSGSALVVDDKMRAYYTGNVKEAGDHDYIHTGREQNLVVADDFNHETNRFDNIRLLLKNEDYPSNLTLHVRDPKVFKRGDNFMMLLGARDLEDRGLALVYESEDGYDWNFKKELRSEDKLGYMWECPDLITLNDKDFLIISPQGVSNQDEKFQNLYQSGYIKIDDLENSPQLGDFNEFDYGFDFYAPQTFEDEKGRRILIGWMGLPDVDYTYPTVENGWVHALTVPRILIERDDKLFQEPIPELKELRLSESSYKTDSNPLELEVTDTFELIINSPSSKGSLTIRNGAQFFWDNGKLELSFESHDERIVKAGAGRDKRIGRVETVEKIQLFADTSSLEFFINNGEIVFSTRYFPDKKDHLLIIDSKNSEVTLFDLGSFKVKRDNGEVLFT